MKEIIIKSQAELDALPDKFDEYTGIYIQTPKKIQIILRKNRGNSIAILWENSSAILRKNSSAELWGFSSAILRENSMVKIYSDYVNLKSVLQESVVIVRDCKPKLPKGIKHLIRTKTAQTTKREFLQIYKEQVQGGKITLYKSVNSDDNCDFYSGKIKYEVGKIVTCPDWNPDKNIECGGGLHLSPTPREALGYNQGKVLKCEVDIKDFVVYPSNITKVRCKKVKILEEL